MPQIMPRMAPICTLLAAVCLTAIVQAQSGPSTPSSSASSLSTAINAFSLDLLKSLNARRAADEGQNVFYSPVSIASALSMVMLGTRHQSRLELIQALHLDQGFETLTDVHRAFKSLLADIEDTRGREYTLRLANRLLVQSNYSISENYKWYAADCYKSIIEQRRFGADATSIREEVNGWVSRKTGGMISSLLDGPLDPFTRLLILNAVYFEGKWRTMFNKRLTKVGRFYNQGLVISPNVTFMRVRGTFRIAHSRSKASGEEFALLELPYNGDMSMFVVLPESRTGLKPLIGELSMDDLRTARAAAKRRELFVNLPKLSLETTYDLRQVLPQMGVKEIFTSRADLSGICNDKNLEVSEAVHKARLLVDEDGSRAAAATSIRAMSRSLKFTPEILVDHPFLFYIQDNGRDLVHFMGTVNTL